MSPAVKFYLIPALLILLFAISLLIRHYTAKRSKPKLSLKDLAQVEHDVATNFARASVGGKSPTLLEIMFKQHFTIKAFTPSTGYNNEHYKMKNVDPTKPITIILNDFDCIYELGVSEDDLAVITRVLTDKIITQGTHGPTIIPDSPESFHE